MISKCTEFDSTNRYQSAKELAAALDRLKAPAVKLKTVLLAGAAVLLLTACALFFIRRNALANAAASPPAVESPAAVASVVPTVFPTVMQTPPHTPAQTPVQTLPPEDAYLSAEAAAYLAVAPVRDGTAVVMKEIFSLEELQNVLEEALDAKDAFYLCVIQTALSSNVNITVPANMNLTVNPGAELVMEEGTALVNGGRIEVDGVPEDPGRLTLAPGATLFCRGEFDFDGVAFCSRLIVENGILTLGDGARICRFGEPAAGSERLVAVMGDVSRIECAHPELAVLEGDGFIWIDTVSGCPEALRENPAMRNISE